VHAVDYRGMIVPMALPTMSEILASDDFQSLPVDAQVRLLAKAIGRMNEREGRIIDTLDEITTILHEIARKLP
jgi:adenylate kinase